jgi:amidase
MRRVNRQPGGSLAGAPGGVHAGAPPEGAARLDATALAELVRAGEASPAELVEGSIRRIEALDPGLGAVITDLSEKALAAARQPVPQGPFHGVPLLLKDLGCNSAGDPLHAGMALLKRLGWTEPEDALGRRFREAGFIVIGKTNVPELGILPTTEPEAYGPTRNPWEPGRSAGGSSGGSAAAVAAGLVAVAHGDDGGGSIRIPASHCGVVGLKPSRGRVPLGADSADPGSELVAAHVLCRSVRDSAAVLDAIRSAPAGGHAPPAPRQPFREQPGADPGPLRIGVMTGAPAGVPDVDPDCVAAAEAAAGALETLGHAVDVAHPEALDDPEFIDSFLARWIAGVASSVEHWEGRLGRSIGPGDVEATTWALVERGRAYTEAERMGTALFHRRLTRRVGEWWDDGFDLLLTPTTAEPAPPLGTFAPVPGDPLAPLMRSVPLAIFTAMFNITGQPAISLPVHWSAAGVPVGAQLVAAHGREDRLIAVAAQLEQALPWVDRWPLAAARR